MTRNVLPIRMNSVERFHFYDDSPEYPNNIFARLFFKGPLDEKTAKRAFDITTERHPISQAIVRRGRWCSYTSTRSRFLWNRGTSVAGQWLNLELEKNCRLFCDYHAESDETEVLFQVHHATADGQGGLQFTRDWMKVYDNLVAGRSPEDGLPTVDPTLYRRRNRLGLFSLSGLKTLLFLPIGIFGALKFSFRKPAPLIKLRPLEDDTLKDDFPCVATYEVTRDQLAAAKSYVNRQNITLNDWITSCCYRSLMCWREQFGLHRSSDWYRIIIPMSIRSFRDRELPACNRAAVIQLDRREDYIVDTQHLNRSVNYELGFIRNGDLQKIFLMVLKGMSLVPFLLKSRSQKKRCRAMTVVTNMGRPFLKTGLEKSGRKIRMGGSELQRVEMVPPIRYGTPVTFAVARYAGKLYLTMHVDTRFVRIQDAKKLLDDFGNRIGDVG